MSDKNIKVGDYVEAIQWACSTCRPPVSFVVTFFCKSNSDLRVGCNTCKAIIMMPKGIYAFDCNNTGYPAPWLRKLPDLSEPETRETQEEISA